jgi:2-amino-4-hydroxy-6-hydroxymethyldihydropteridine diphosphokinase
MAVFIALSSNLDGPRRQIREALERLSTAPGVRLERCSWLYRTRPWGLADQPMFWNAVARVETGLEPRALLRRLQAIERDMARGPRTRRWGPRRIDLDLLLYHARRIDEPGLTVPHPRMEQRLFVLAPLLEIAPHAGCPGTARPYALSLARLAVGRGDAVRVEPPRPTCFSSGGPGLAMKAADQTLKITSGSPDETLALGRRIGKALSGGQTVALIGELGAGKTCLAQGLAAGLGVEGRVVSPTFLIHRIYDGKLRLHHFDFYRLEGEDDLESVGFYDFQTETPPSVVVVEWADRFPDALDPPLLEIVLRPGKTDSERAIRLRSRGMAPEVWQGIMREAETP